MRLTEKRDYLIDPDRRSYMNRQERGVLALLDGIETFTQCCTPAYADACAVIEMGMPSLFRAARAMLNYAPDTLRRGAIDARYAELMAAWHIDPDTLEWTGR